MPSVFVHAAPALALVPAFAGPACRRGCKPDFAQCTYAGASIVPGFCTNTRCEPCTFDRAGCEVVVGITLGTVTERPNLGHALPTAPGTPGSRGPDEVHRAMVARLELKKYA